ncbi:MAG: hypothetical protein RIT28_1288, partial [Pseudomonadota bacterium]
MTQKNEGLGGQLAALGALALLIAALTLDPT